MIDNDLYWFIMIYIFVIYIFVIENQRWLKLIEPVELSFEASFDGKNIMTARFIRFTR